MIFINDHKQQQLFDPWNDFGPKRRQMLDGGWPALFQREILPELPVALLFPFLKEEFGRPTKELYTVLGTLLLQQVKNLTDEETVEQLAFNEQWHFAFDISDKSDKSLYICMRTLSYYREKVAANHLEEAIFEAVTAKLAKVFSVDTDSQRLDSVHIKSNMRRLGRVTIFAKTIQNFLKNLKRKYPELFPLVDEKIVDKYLPKKAVGLFAMVKPDKAKKTLNEVASDLYYLIERFKDDKKAAALYSYKHLERVLDEQCKVTKSKGKTKVSAKPAKEVPADSLQNPSDPDAAYSGHKGQGYQAQVMETFTDTDDKEEKKKTLNLITHVAVEKASEHDSNALIPAIDSAKEQGLDPKELLADSHYGSEENVEDARKKGVEIVSPVMGEEKKEAGLSQFIFDKKGYVVTCPMGHKPERKSMGKRYSNGFCRETCAACDLLKKCPVKLEKKFACLRYTKKALRCARRRAHEQTEEFKDSYRWRAGVEAAMSEFDRRTGVKHLRVRGFKAVCLAVFLKAAGLNIFRAVAVQKARKKADPGGNPGLFWIVIAFWAFKELFSMAQGRWKYFSPPKFVGQSKLAAITG
jgi:hypothetical protein